MKEKFIVTFDSGTATALLKSGFTEVPSGNGNLHTFINDQRLKFDSSIDMRKIKFTNMLCF